MSTSRTRRRRTLSITAIAVLAAGAAILGTQSALHLTQAPGFQGNVCAPTGRTVARSPASTWCPAWWRRRAPR